MRHLVTHTALGLYFAKIGEYNFAGLFIAMALIMVILTLRGSR